MKITRILACHVELPLHEGRHAWSGGRSVDVFDSTVVRVETDEGLVGHGEVCQIGPAYLPSYAEGVRSGVAKLEAAVGLRTLGRLGPLAFPPIDALTSVRRYERRGIVRSVASNLWLLTRYLAGADTDKLARAYRT